MDECARLPAGAAPELAEARLAAPRLLAFAAPQRFLLRGLILRVELCHGGAISVGPVPTGRLVYMNDPAAGGNRPYRYFLKEELFPSACVMTHRSRQGAAALPKDQTCKSATHPPSADDLEMHCNLEKRPDLASADHSKKRSNLENPGDLKVLHRQTSNVDD